MRRFERLRSIINSAAPANVVTASALTITLTWNSAGVSYRQSRVPVEADGHIFLCA